MRFLTDEELDELITEHVNTGDPMDELIYNALIELKVLRINYPKRKEKQDD